MSKMNIENIRQVYDDIKYDDKYTSIKLSKETFIALCDKANLEQEEFLYCDEEKKVPEKINNWITSVGRVNDSNIEEYLHKLFEQQTILYFKINAIIDYLQNKGE